ncbi:MAG: MerR family transcriptional regulator [Ferruginibacter sp.]
MLDVLMINFSDYIITENRLLYLISLGGNDITLMYKNLVERKFYIGEASISRKNLNHWEKEGLIPYNYKESGWRKFSLVEFAWLRIINELRNLGFSLEKIKVIKGQLFDINIEEYKAFLLKALENFNGEIKNKEDVLKTFKREDIPKATWDYIFEEGQISNFSVLILQILLDNHNLCLVIDEDNNCQFVVLGEYVKEKKQLNQDILNSIINKSFVIINLRKIIHGFFSNEKINNDNDYIIGFLNKKEKEIIEKIREEDLKEVKIRFANNKPVLLELTKSINKDEAINKMTRLLKKGEYKDITIKTRDGKLLSYEQTDLIKFN